MVRTSLLHCNKACLLGHVSTLLGYNVHGPVGGRHKRAQERNIQDFFFRQVIVKCFRYRMRVVVGRTR